jgi:hypothetical protein
MVTFDAVGPSSSGIHSTTSPLTWSHTCAATANLILVGVNLSNGTFANVTAVTYGGIACTLVPGAQVYAGNTGTAGPAQVFALVNPPTGANTVSVTATGGFDIIGGSLSFIAAGSFGTPVKGGSSGGSAAASVSIVGTTSGGFVVTMVQSGSGVTSATAPNVSRWITNAGGSTAADNAGMSTDPSTGATVTPAWVLVNDTNAIVGFEILPTGAGGVGILPQQAKKRMPAIFTRIAAPRRSAVYSR